jgi:hypothetical protein
MLADTQETLGKARMFTLRVWLIRKDEQTAEWRARLQDTQNGEVVYFKDWQALTTHIECILQNQNQQALDRREI